MQYNTWKRVSPSNPVSSHPAFCLSSLSLSVSLLLFVTEIALLSHSPSFSPRPLSFALKHPKSCARRDAQESFARRVVAGVSAYARSDFIRLLRFQNLHRVAESRAESVENEPAALQSPHLVSRIFMIIILIH